MAKGKEYLKYILLHFISNNDSFIHILFNIKYLNNDSDYINYVI